MKEKKTGISFIKIGITSKKIILKRFMISFSYQFLILCNEAKLKLSILVKSEDDFKQDIFCGWRQI